MSVYEQVVEKFKRQDIDIKGKYLLINDEFNGKKVRPIFSKDKSVVCFPVLDHDLSDCYGEDMYSPRCFFVDGIYSTFIKCGTMSINVEIYVLYD